MNKPRSIRIGTPIVLNDGNYTALAFSAGIYKLLNNDTGEVTYSSQVDLASRFTQTPDIVEHTGLDLSDADIVDDATVQALIPHLEEVINGTALPGGQPREQYAPTRSTESKLEAKVAELAGTPLERGKGTLKRNRLRYIEFGPAGLSDGRGSKKAAPMAHVDGRIVEALAHIIAKQRDKSTPSLDKLRELLREHLLLVAADDRPDLPSKSTLRRYMYLMDHGRYTTGSAVNRQSVALRTKTVTKARPAILPGSEVQADATQLDIFVKGPDGVPYRPHASIFLCKATNSILAVHITPTAPTGADHSVLLAQCLVPRALRPNAEFFRELELPSMTWAKMLSAEDLKRFETFRPFIVPQRILTDNGADYVSKAFRSACAFLGITLTESSIHSATNKAGVERAFLSIKTMLLQHLPGFTGGSIESRGVAPDKEDGLLDEDTFTMLLDRWIAVVWQNYQHETLRDPLFPSIIHSPNSMYAAMFDMTGFVPIPLTAADYIELMPTELRTIQHDGITIKHRRYDSVELSSYRNMKDANGKSMMWEVKYEPHNPAQVWVRDPESRDWIVCNWLNGRAFEKPFSNDFRDAALEWTREYGTVSAAQSHQLTRRIVKMQHEETKAERKAEHRRLAAAKRKEGAGFPVIPAVHPSTGEAFETESEMYDTDEFLDMDTQPVNTFGFMRADGF